MTPIPNPVGFLAFFNLGGQELIFVVFLAFLLFGAKKIPELMRSLGRAQGEFQHAKKAFDAEVAATDTPAGKATAPTAPEAAQARAAVESTAGTTTTTVDDAALAEVRSEAELLGIETEGKDIETLRREIEAKRAV